MTRSETRSLLVIRRELTDETFSDSTVDAWHEALDDESFDDARAAVAVAARHGRVTIASIVAELPKPQPERKVPLCIRCRMIEAMPTRTRCEMCQAAVEDEIAHGRRSPAMTAAIANARRRGERSHGPDNSADHL